MSQPPIQLVCFDLGGVLMRICRRWDEAADCAGLMLPASLDSRTANGKLKVHFSDFETGRIDDGRYCQEVGTLLGLAPEQVRRIIFAWLRGPYPGIDDLIDSLHYAKMRTACLSNTNAVHWSIMQSPGPNRLPLDRMDFRFASHLIGHMKPDAAIYEHLEHAVGLPPTEILFFDDMPENIEAAKKRGWQAELITDNDPVGQIRVYLQHCGVL